ncbi:MAG: PD-(D/E)XK nuclease family protein [Cystobacterineae bacterium]|nr:PD-(D/E)XK nuclease family protein [Cystobacterineae bacterium]
MKKQPQSLHLFTTVEHLEQTLRQEARTHVVAHAQNYMLLSRFLEQCIPFAEKRLCSFQEQTLVAWEMIRRHPREIRESESDFYVAQLFVEQLKSIRLQGCSLEAWKQVAFKLKEHASLLWFADVWEEYSLSLSARLLMDEVDVLCAAIDELEKGKLPPKLRCISKVFVHELIQITPLEQRFFFALDKALYAVGCELFLETRGVDNPELDGLVDELHGDFEKAEESLNANLNLMRDVLSSSSPAFELCKHMFGETLPTTQELPWDCFVAPSACGEVRETARRIAHLLKRGVAPESIAVVLCSEAHRADALWNAFSSYSIPAYIQEELPLSSCALGNAVLSWLKWIEDGFPVEQAHVFFSNPLFKKTFVSYDDVGIWLQRAGIGAHSKQESLDGYAERLSFLQESAPWGAPQRFFFETFKKHIAVAKNAVGKIPQEGTFQNMLDAWLSSFQELGFNLHALMPEQLQHEKNTLFGHPEGFSFNPFEQQMHRKMLARENAAGAFFRQACAEWKLRLEKTGGGLHKLTRKAFSEWVLTCFGNEVVRMREPKTAGVSIGHFKAMRGQKYKHVFFVGMKDGAFSQKKKSTLISEALQPLVNAKSTRLLFRMQRGEQLHKLPEDIVVEREHFIEAVTCATEKLWFSYALAEHGEREVVPSLFWQEALRISKKTTPTLVQTKRFSQQPSEGMTEADFRGCVAQKIRRNFYERKQEMPWAEAALRKESWFVSLSEKSEAERERFYFQRDRTRKLGAYTGNVLSPKTEKYLKELTQLPWSAYALGRLGGCAFWFFMSHVLKGEFFENFNIDVGAKAKGVLLHRALALLGADGVSLLKTTQAQRREKIAQAVKAARGEVKGLAHAELWALCCEEVEEELLEFLNSKSFFPLGIPLQIFPEWSFEEKAYLKEGSTLDLKAEPELSSFVSEAQVLKLAGRLDRLDVLEGGRVGVVDYKLGKRGSKNKYRESVLLNDFQLLLYLFVLRKKGMCANQAAWVFIREKTHFLLEEFITQEELNEILEEDLAARISLKEKGKPNLLNRMEALVSTIKEGKFAPISVDCGYCPFKRACRVSEKMKTQVEN